jgi:hypothetical protein
MQIRQSAVSGSAAAPSGLANFSHFIWMQHAESVKAPEIAYVDCQNLAYAMDVHAGGQPGIVDLHTLDIMRDQQCAPAVVRLAAVGQKLEISLDHPCKTVGLSNGEAKSVFVPRAG